MEEIVTVVSNVGFPIAVAVYMLVVNGKKIDENTAMLNKFNALIEKLLSKLSD